MIMHYVSSSNLDAVGYDPSSQTLRIQFHNGTYDYFNVPPKIYQDLMSAGSKGAYHARYIKDSYPYRRL